MAAPKRDLGEIDWSKCPGVRRDPHTLSGAWRFDRSRVPIYALFMNLSSGMTIPEFLEQFEGIEEGQVRSVLDFLAERLEGTGTE